MFLPPIAGPKSKGRKYWTIGFVTLVCVGSITLWLKFRGNAGQQGKLITSGGREIAAALQAQRESELSAAGGLDAKQIHELVQAEAKAIESRLPQAVDPEVLAHLVAGVEGIAGRAPQLQEEIKRQSSADPVAQSLAQLSALSEQHPHFTTNGSAKSAPTRQSAENEARLLQAELKQRNPAAEAVLTGLGLFESVSADTTAEEWFQAEWENANREFDSGKTFSQLLETKQRRGSLQVVPRRAATDAAVMCQIALNLKGLVLDRELRLQQALSGNPDAAAKSWKQETAALQSEAWRLRQSGNLNVALTAGAEPFTLWAQRVFELRQTEVELRAAALSLLNAGAVALLDSRQVQAKLPSDCAIVEFLRYGREIAGANQVQDCYGAAVICPGQEVRWLELGLASDVDTLIYRYNDFVRRGEATAPRESDFTKLWHDLSEKIWRPVERALPKETKTVLVCPDSQIHLVSFASLESAGAFVAERYRIETRTGSRTLFAPRREHTVRQGIDVWANPDFNAPLTVSPTNMTVGESDVLGWARSMVGEAKLGELESLPGTQKEVENLQASAKSMGGIPVKVHTAARATELALREVDNPYVLVLATHGFSFPNPKSNNAELPTALTRILAPEVLRIEQPLARSGLAFAGANRTLGQWRERTLPPSDEDGILTATEAANLKLGNTWLVVLSACDTIRGGAVDGETPLCIKMGFLQAGAEHVLFSLWRLDDQYSADFMNRFFLSALQNRDAVRALAELQAGELKKLRTQPGQNTLWRAVKLAGPYAMNRSGPAR